MILEFLIGAAVGALVGAAVIGICECIEYATRIFDKFPKCTRVKYIKVDSWVGKCLRHSPHPRIRAALDGEGGTLLAIHQEDNRISYVESMSNNLSSDFDDCSGYMINRYDREAIRI